MQSTVTELLRPPRRREMSSLVVASAQFRAIRDRIRALDPEIDEETLADTVEGLTGLHEVLAAIVRSALTDEALVGGLRQRIDDMEARLGRLQDRAAKRRQVARDVMLEAEIRKIV